MRRGLSFAIVAMFAVGPGLAEATQMDVTAANIYLQPDDAVRLTLDGIAADPRHAPEITATAVMAAPAQAVAIEAAAVAAVPHRAAEITQAVDAARAQRDAQFAALPRLVADSPSGEVITEPSGFARMWMNGSGPGLTYELVWRNETGAGGIR